MSERLDFRPDGVSDIIRRAEKRAEDEWAAEQRPEFLDELPESDLLLKALVRRGDLYKESMQSLRMTMGGYMIVQETYLRIYSVGPDV